jgi:hypothetical protein
MKKSICALRVVVVALACALDAGGIALANCDTNYGDQLYNWVDEDARRQSLALAEADYTSRLNNGRVLEYDSLKILAVKLSAYLDELVARQQEGDRRRSALGAAAASLDLQRDSTQLLDALLARAGDIRALSQRLRTLAAPVDLAEFRALGAQHVGRSTLLGSIAGLANTGGDTLNVRYSFNVQINFDEHGQAQGGQVGLGGNEDVQMADKVALVLIQRPEYISQIIGYAYFTIRFTVYAIESSGCEQRLRHQADRASDAIRLLATVLPDEAEVFAIYTHLLTESQVRFAAAQAALEDSINTLDARWRNLLSFTLAQLDVAGKTLTAERVEILRRAYDSGDPLGRVFDQLALTQMTLRLQELQRFALREEVLIGSVCRDTAGISAAENLLDRRQEALAQLELLRRLHYFVPLQSTFDGVADRMRRRVPRAESLVRAGGDLACAFTTGARAVMMGGEGAAIVGSPATGTFVPVESSEPLRAYSATRQAAREWAQRTARQQRTAIRTSGGNLCAIFSSGGVYRCGTPSDGDPGLATMFPQAPGSPYLNIGQGANDGGFANDARRVEQQVADAKANIDQRITSLRANNQAITLAIPAWITVNSAGMSELNNAEVTKLAAETAARETAAQRDSLILRETAERLAQFSREGTDPAVLRDLMNGIGATDASLPDLQPGMVLPNGPVLPGLTHRDRVYPRDTSTAQRAILREQVKRGELQDQPRALLHSRLTAMAARFAAGESLGGEAIANALVLDAASLRYVERGALSQASLSSVAADGSIIEYAYEGGLVPERTLLSRAERFDIESRILAQQQSLAGTALGGSAIDLRPRLDALNLSTRLGNNAQDAFFAGQILDGEALLEVATIAADLVTSWTPGVSWGRDIYEALIGNNLITGEELDNFSRTVAIVGAITGGLGSKGIHSIETVSRTASRLHPELVPLVREFGSLAERVAEKVSLIRAEFTSIPAGHAAEQVGKLTEEAFSFGASVSPITAQHIRNVIAVGQPYLDIRATNSGLVYLARAEQIGIQGERLSELPLLLVAVNTTGVGDSIRTAYWYTNKYNLEDIEKIIAGVGEQRFRRLPVQGTF